MIPSTRLTEFPVILSDLGPLHAVPEVLGDHVTALTHAVGVYNQVRNAVVDRVSGGAESGAGHNDTYGQYLSEAYADVLAKWRECGTDVFLELASLHGTSSVADCHAAHLDLMRLLDALRSPDDAIHAPARETLRFWQQVDLKLPFPDMHSGAGRPGEPGFVAHYRQANVVIERLWTMLNTDLANKSADVVREEADAVAVQLEGLEVEALLAGLLDVAARCAAAQEQRQALRRELATISDCVRQLATS
ncbi:hypothetical protein [Lentzea sp. E54]|uniref:hypothetical protein n=1 Tax=Lentzea xerophila TaxID=3435883 RepID=UPI003DA4C5D5